MDVRRYEEVLPLTEEEGWFWVLVVLDPMIFASLSASETHHTRRFLP